MGTNDYAILKSTANSNGINLSGQQSNANVMCLTCHRAHASGWDSMTRWNMEAEFIVYGGRYPGIDNSSSAQYAQGRTTVKMQKTFMTGGPDHLPLTREASAISVITKTEKE
jgi:hypothetical protein